MLYTCVPHRNTCAHLSPCTTHEGGQEPEVPPLSKWINNQSVSLDMDGPSLTVTSRQDSSTPGARINGIKVVIARNYVDGVKDLAK